MDDPQDAKVLTNYLTAIYVWVVEQHWRWFDRLDEWLCENHSKRWPMWWEY